MGESRVVVVAYAWSMETEGQRIEDLLDTFVRGSRRNVLLVVDQEVTQGVM